MYSIKRFCTTMQLLTSGTIEDFSNASTLCQRNWLANMTGWPLTTKQITVAVERIKHQGIRSKK